MEEELFRQLVVQTHLVHPSREPTELIVIGRGGGGQDFILDFNSAARAVAKHVDGHDTVVLDKLLVYWVQKDSTATKAMDT